LKNREKIVALLPMKAHSERVKGKNFREFCGKPLFRWILDTLLEVEEIDELVINTDARQILAENGLTDADRIRIRDRRPEICGDLVSMNLVIADDVANVDADIFLMTHTTNPLMAADTVRAALSAFRAARSDDEVDSLFTVDRIQTRFYRADGSAVNHDPNNLVRTQDLEPWFEENSNLYIFTRESFGATNARIGKHPMMFETPKFESIDIDTPEDWSLAVAVAGYLMESK
jgi:CMP-N-acetylneuraminic acid synthetase